MPISIPEVRAAPQGTAELTFDQVAQNMMDQVQAMDRQAGGKPTRFTHLQVMRRHWQALKQMQEAKCHVAGQEQDRS